LLWYRRARPAHTPYGAKRPSLYQYQGVCVSLPRYITHVYVEFFPHELNRGWVKKAVWIELATVWNHFFGWITKAKPLLS